MRKSKIISKRFKILLIVAIVLTGVTSAGDIFFVINGVITKIWLKTGIANFSHHILRVLIYLCCFVLLINMALDKKPFSRVLITGSKLTGILFIIAGFLFPRLPNYSIPFPYMKIFSSGDFVLIDGAILVPGILLYLLGCILKEGFHMQDEVDTLL